MNKRNLLVLVCIMLIAVLTLVSCGGKDNKDPEHEHTYNTSVYVSDATHHWYGASCEHSDLKVQVEAHADANKDGVCDKCEYVTCTHEYADEWTSDENNHWHASTCGCEVIADKSAHADSNKDGKCDACEYVTCTHTFAENYSSDENGHWLAYTCGCELEPEVESHVDTDKNGICDTCSYVTCAHNPESAWTSDVHTHWHATDCGCEVKIDEAAHVDEDADGACDVCEYVCDHPEKTEWSSDENGHWHDPQCDHEVVVTVVPHEDINKDGACDVCGYEDPSHEHTFEIAYNASQHYYVSTCGHVIAKDFANHVDSDENGVCDTCPAYVGGLGDVVDSTTSKDAASKVNGGTFTGAYGTGNDPYVENQSYELRDGYTVRNTSYSVEYISTYINNDGQPALFKANIYPEENDRLEVDSYATDLALLNGLEYSLLYAYTGIGVEDFVYNLYEYAQTNAVSGYTESYDATTGAYGFSYAVENTDWDGSVYIYVIDFAVTVTDGTITEVVATGYEYYGDTFVLDTENNIYHIVNDEPGNKQVLTINQTIGARSTEANPYSYDKIGMDSLVLINQATGEQIKNGDTVYILAGKDNALTIVVPDEDVEKLPNIGLVVSYDPYDWALVGATYSGNKYPFVLYTYSKVNTYTITFDSAVEFIQFTLVVDYSAPTSIKGATVDAEGNKTEATTAEVYQGSNITLGVIPNNDTSSSRVTASVTTGDPDAVTLIPEGNNWIFNASETGVYTVTFAAAGNPAVTTSVKVTVVDPPAASTILNGTHHLDMLSGENGMIQFTPESEGASKGTVRIVFDDAMAYDRVIIDETAAYEYVDGEVVLTHVSGDGLAKIGGIKFSDNYEIVLVIYPYEMPIMVNEYTFTLGEDVVIPDGTMNAPYTITESTDLDVKLAAEQALHYIFMPEADGTVTISYTGSDDVNIGYGTFNYMLLDPMFNTSITVDVTKNAPLYIKLDTWSGEALEYDVSIVFEQASSEGPTLESLAGTWEGTESGSMIYQGKVFDLVLNINADGTGTGTHSETDIGDFNISSVVIDGTNVTITTDAKSTKNTLYLTYADGSLSLISGNMGMMFGNTINLTLTAPAGGGEGGNGGESGSLSAVVGTWTGSESGSMIYSGQVFDLIFNINADGTGTGTHGSTDIGSFNILSVTVDGSTVTVTTDAATNNNVLTFNLENDKLTLASGSGMMFGSVVELTKESEGGNSGNDGALTLDSLVGTWTGTESGSTIMADQVFDLTLTINANGTGSGSHSMLGSFNIVSVEIEGETIVVTTDAPSNNKVLNLVLADGKLTLASGQGLMYTSVVELTKNASSGNEGGDSGDVTVPTLEELAGDWTGEENYNGSISYYIVTVNADGTGSGSYSMDYGPGGIFTTTFDITAITIDGATVTFSTITTGEYSGTEQDVVFTYADGALSSDKGLIWGALTLTPGSSSDGGNTETPEGTAVVGGASYDSATVLELADANYVTTIAAGEKAYFAIEHDFASMTAIYEITFVVTIGDCTLYSVTYNMAGENATPLPMNYCISSIDANDWRAVIAIENTTDAEVTYAIEVTYVTAQA